METASIRFVSQIWCWKHELAKLAEPGIVYSTTQASGVLKSQRHEFPPCIKTQISDCFTGWFFPPLCRLWTSGWSYNTFYYLMPLLDSKSTSIIRLTEKPSMAECQSGLRHGTEQRACSLSQRSVMVLPADLSCGILLSERSEPL